VTCPDTDTDDRGSSPYPAMRASSAGEKYSSMGTAAAASTKWRKTTSATLLRAMLMSVLPVGFGPNQLLYIWREVVRCVGALGEERRGGRDGGERKKKRFDRLVRHVDLDLCAQHVCTSSTALLDHVKQAAMIIQRAKVSQSRVRVVQVSCAVVGLLGLLVPPSYPGPLWPLPICVLRCLAQSRAQEESITKVGGRDP
jgi:hypothetical protein